MTRDSYLRRESMVSAAINCIISIGFFVVFFGGLDTITVWGIGNYAFDFLPQSFAVSLMSGLVPGLLARKAIASHRITGRTLPASAVIAAAFAGAVGGLLVGAGAIAGLLWLTGLATLPAVPAFVLKVLYGAVLGAIVTYVSLARIVR